MVTNDVSRANSQGNTGVYYADNNGVIRKNYWGSKREFGRTGTFYYGADGKLVDGIQVINGKVYYFD